MTRLSLSFFMAVDDGDNSDQTAEVCHISVSQSRRKGRRQTKAMVHLAIIPDSEPLETTIPSVVHSCHEPQSPRVQHSVTAASTLILPTVNLTQPSLCPTSDFDYDMTSNYDSNADDLDGVFVHNLATYKPPETAKEPRI